MDLSVIVPLIDPRGDAVDHLRTWTHGQTLPRDRYQMVLVADGRHPEAERAVAELLEPHDTITHARDVDGRDNFYEGAGLYDAGAAAAAAPWLVLTENHCEADPNCLAAAAAAIDADPEVDAFTFDHGHMCANEVARMSARWFREVYAEWDKKQGGWTRLNAVGCAIERKAYLDAGGMPAPYGLFSVVLLAARLYEQGRKVGHADGALVHHQHEERMRDHHLHSADHTRGEFDARADLAPAFSERYLGWEAAWARKLRYRPAVARRLAAALARETARAAMRRRQDVPWLIRELVGVLPAALLGPRPYTLKEHVAFLWNEQIAEHVPFPRGWRWRSYLRGQDRVVRLTQLRWIQDRQRGPMDEPLREPHSPAEALDPGGVVGAYALERQNGSAYRWTEPVSLVRVSGASGPRQLAIGTGGLRGSPLEAVSGVYVGGRRVPRARLGDEGGRLVVPLPETESDEPVEVAVLARPHPAAPGDRRRLGLPVFSVDLT
ncbi:MAG: hypothetical protein ACJ766_11405 [Thermoleophilaceae bacterium]